MRVEHLILGLKNVEACLLQLGAGDAQILNVRALQEGVEVVLCLNEIALCLTERYFRLGNLIERAGVGRHGHGSITAIYTVLAEGDDNNDPVVDIARASLDGQMVLSRRLADAAQACAVPRTWPGPARTPAPA